MFTEQQLDRYMTCAAGDLGPDCSDDWVRALEQLIENANEILSVLRDVRQHGLSDNGSFEEESKLSARLNALLAKLTCATDLGAPVYRFVGKIFSNGVDQEEMVDGEIVAVWTENDVGYSGPHFGRVIRARKMWVQIFHFWSDGEPYIADEHTIERWSRAAVVKYPLRQGE